MFNYFKEWIRKRRERKLWSHLSPEARKNILDYKKEELKYMMNVFSLIKMANEKFCMESKNERV